MNKLFAAGIAAITALLLASCQQPSAPTDVSDPYPDVLVVGDSISAGTYGITDPGKHWWEYVATHLSARSTGLHAMPGWTTEAALQSPPTGDFDIVLIALGTNDQVANADPVAYRQRLKTIASWGAQCHIIAPWERKGFALATAPPPAHELVAYTLNALAASRESGCGFTDWSNIDSADWTWDGLHPTPAGNQQLAAAVASDLIVK